MTMKHILAALLLGTTAAGAADLNVLQGRQALPPTQPFAWTGLYAGINVGYGWGSDTLGYKPTDPVSAQAVAAAAKAGVAASFSSNLNGVIGGFQGGYNWQFGQFVAGLETDIDISGIGGGQTWASAIPARIPIPVSISTHQQLDWLGTTRGRFGYLLIPTFMLYGTGGLAYGGTEASAVATAMVTPAFGITANTSSSQIKTGWAAGAGAEWALPSNWKARAEWLHYDLGTMNWNAPIIATNIILNFSANQRGDIIRAGLSRSF
jgi:outer membrane immunogenic protein